MTETVHVAPGASAVPALGGLRLNQDAAVSGAAVGPLGWRGSVVLAAAAVRDRPSLLGAGLLGFLARGGLLVFLLPIVVLPTPTGIGTFIGGTALTGAGATDSLIRLVAAIVVGILVWLVLGVLLGAVADVLLVRASLEAELSRTAGGAQSADRLATALTPVSLRMVASVAVVRLIAMVPLAVAFGWGAARLATAVYNELILPRDLAVPLALRALRQAADAAVVVVAAWIVAELVGGLAARWLIARGGWTLAAFPRSWMLFLRRPLTGTATFLLPLVLLVAVLTATVAASATLWGLLQALLADGVMILVAIPATIVFVAVWGGGLLLVGLIVTWRNILGGLDTLRALPAADPSTAGRAEGAGVPSGEGLDVRADAPAGGLSG